MVNINVPSKRTNIMFYPSSTVNLGIFLKLTFRTCFKIHNPNFSVKLSFPISDIRDASKPFVCDVCSKGFPQNWQLTRHYRSHTGEKPFKCTMCDKSFAVSSNLRTHMFNMHTSRHLNLIP